MICYAYSMHLICHVSPGRFPNYASWYKEKGLQNIQNTVLHIPWKSKMSKILKNRTKVTMLIQKKRQCYLGQLVFWQMVPDMQNIVSYCMRMNWNRIVLWKNKEHVRYLPSTYGIRQTRKVFVGGFQSSDTNSTWSGSKQEIGHYYVWYRTRGLDGFPNFWCIRK